MDEACAIYLNSKTSFLFYKSPKWIAVEKVLCRTCVWVVSIPLKLTYYIQK